MRNAQVVGCSLSRPMVDAAADLPVALKAVHGFQPTLGGLRDVPPGRLEAWIRRLVVGSDLAQFTSPAQERQVTETR